MEFSYERMLFLIESHRRNGDNAVYVHNLLETAWPQEAVSLRRVQQLMKELNDGTRQSFARLLGQGRPVSEIRRNAIDRVSEAIAENNNLSERKLARLLNLNDTMIHRILNEDLEMMWMKTQWVPHQLTDAHRLLRVERCQDMLLAFRSRITKANLVNVDEKWLFARYLLPKNDVGSWVGPGGDICRLLHVCKQKTNISYMLLFLFQASNTLK